MHNRTRSRDSSCCFLLRLCPWPQTAEELRLRWLRLRTNDKELVIAPGATCTLVLVHKEHEKTEEDGEEGDGAE